METIIVETFDSGLRRELEQIAKSTEGVTVAPPLFLPQTHADVAIQITITMNLTGPALILALTPLVKAIRASNNRARLDKDKTQPDTQVHHAMEDADAIKVLMSYQKSIDKAVNDGDEEAAEDKLV